MINKNFYSKTAFLLYAIPFLTFVIFGGLSRANEAYFWLPEGLQRNNIINLAPAKVLPGGCTLDNECPRFAGAEFIGIDPVALSNEFKRVIVWPAMATPPQMLGTKVYRYVLICKWDADMEMYYWCSDLLELGTVEAGEYVDFPIISHPLYPLGIPSGIYDIFIAITHLNDLDDVVYDFYTVDVD